MKSHPIKYQLKTKIGEELRAFRASDPLIFNDETIETFLDTLLYPIKDPAVRLEGLESRVVNALKKILLDDSASKEEISASFSDFVKIEPFLLKILYLTDSASYQSVVTAKSGLAKSIKLIGLNPGNVDFNTSPLLALNLPHFAAHLCRTYQLRNLESHVCLDWPKKDFFENIESVLIIYIRATYLKLSAIKSVIYQEPDLTNYLNKVVHEFELWQKRFVHITGIEKFEEIDLHAVESEDWSENDKRVLREGKIDDLRKNISENSMVVLGEPGMGKSTTLQYMSFNDAKELLSKTLNTDIKIPVYLELKLFSKQGNIINVAANKIGITTEKLIEYFIKGKITLFLDGLNEVFEEIRKSIRLEIQELIITYPELTIIITLRPLAYYNEFKDTPVFVLQRMENEQVEEFLVKNCNHSQTRILILNEIKNNLRLGKIVRVPLLLKMLINVALNNKGIIPNNKVQIIKSFIQNLYERETKKMITDMDFRIIHRLLCFTGYKTRELNQSNVGWRIEELEAILEKRIESSRFKISAYEFLDFAIDLNILVKDENKYTFIHELYQEYYASEEIFRLSALEK